MGEVYKARDPRLDRVVAIKLAGAAFSERFGREARAIASLNHPNICQIYDIGPDYLVMELISGQPLSSLIDGRPMPLEQVVSLAAQMADGLDEARLKGIVHRDLKPANILVTAKGQVKILDFGLAKSSAPGEPDGTTVTDLMTQPGAVMGTFPYMSPEQGKGEPVDHRSDLFSLGIVLYEMASGRRPFAGATPVALLHEIAHKPPAPLASPDPRLDRIVGKLLEKDPALRYQTAAELQADLNWLAQPRPQPAVRSPLLLGLAVSALAAAGVWFGFFRDAEPPAAGAPTVLPFTTFPGSETSPAFSPDGKQLAYAWDGESADGARIYVQRLDAATPLRVSNGPGNDGSPVWSPDGGQIAFVRNNGSSGNVYLIPSLGGPERRLTEVSAGQAVSRLAWSPDGSSLVLSDRIPGADYDCLYRITISTGERQRISTGSAPHLFSDRAPSYSPDGSRIVFVRELDYFVDDLFWIPAAGGESTRLTHDRRSVNTPSWTPDGRFIVFQSDRALTSGIWKVPAAGGAPVPAAAATGSMAGVALSRQGDRLAYVQSVTDFNIWRLQTSPGRDRRPDRVVGSTRLDTSPQYSPDGTRIAYASDRSGSFEIWVSDASGANASQLTHIGRGSVGSPAWSPDGKRIAFDARPERSPDIFVINADGGTPLRVTTELTREVIPSWSRDGQWLYFASDRSGEFRIWKVRMGPQGALGEPVAVTRRNGWISQESPDGKDLYYSPTAAGGVWRMPAGGGEETLVLGQLATRDNRFWTVTAKGIYFSTGTDTPRPVIQFYDFASRRATVLFTGDKPLVAGYGGLSASPDGRSLLYSQLDQKGSDIVVLDHRK
jgi:Tol biopolymer transport system component/tRNA A-37 threonylcarbamoyl transferase component Bud32